MPITTLFVGIDVSLKTNQVCSINFNQDVFFHIFGSLAKDDDAFC